MVVEPIKRAVAIVLSCLLRRTTQLPSIGKPIELKAREEVSARGHPPWQSSMT
jgi:hypothetical protein